jgi:tetratricopeptide (TPR) repeat protein
MVLSRFLAALLASLLLASGPVRADEVQKIDQQYRSGDLTGALERVELYLVKNPKNAKARFLKGLILTDQNRIDDAIEVMSALTEDYPELPEPYNNLAVLHASQGRYQTAMHALEAAIRAHPNYATAHENLGDLHAKLASIAYEKAVTLDSKNTTAQAKLTLIRSLPGQQAAQPAAAKPATAAPLSVPESGQPAPAK